MKNTKKKGFTLTELTVVLVIIAIIAAIAVPSFIKYWRIAEFQSHGHFRCIEGQVRYLKNRFLSEF